MDINFQQIINNDPTLIEKLNDARKEGLSSGEANSIFDKEDMEALGKSTGIFEDNASIDNLDGEDWALMVEELDQAMENLGENTDLTWEALEGEEIELKNYEIIAKYVNGDVNNDAADDLTVQSLIQDAVLLSEAEQREIFANAEYDMKGYEAHPYTDENGNEGVYFSKVNDEGNTECVKALKVKDDNGQERTMIVHTTIQNNDQYDGVGKTEVYEYNEPPKPTIKDNDDGYRPTPTPEPVPEPTTEPTPEPTTEPVPEPTTEPTPEPTTPDEPPCPEAPTEPVPEPTTEPTPEPTTPDEPPCPEAPTEVPTGEERPTELPTTPVEPTTEPTPEPTTEPVPEPTTELTPEPETTPPNIPDAELGDEVDVVEPSEENNPPVETTPIEEPPVVETTQEEDVPEETPPPTNTTPSVDTPAESTPTEETPTVDETPEDDTAGEDNANSDTPSDDTGETGNDVPCEDSPFEESPEEENRDENLYETE